MESIFLRRSDSTDPTGMSRDLYLGIRQAQSLYFLAHENHNNRIEFAKKIEWSRFVPFPNSQFRLTIGACNAVFLLLFLKNYRGFGQVSGAIATSRYDFPTACRVSIALCPTIILPKLS